MILLHSIPTEKSKTVLSYKDLIDFDISIVDTLNRSLETVRAQTQLYVDTYNRYVTSGTMYYGSNSVGTVTDIRRNSTVTDYDITDYRVFGDTNTTYHIRYPEISPLTLADTEPFSLGSI